MYFQSTVPRAIVGALLLFLMGFSVSGVRSVEAAQYFDKDDMKGMGQLSTALMAWYEVNQLGLPKNDSDMKKILNLLKKVHSECSKVTDKTLEKVDPEFAVQWRRNLQDGARMYEAGMRASWKAKKQKRKPTKDEASQMSGGQNRMVKFHGYYNANIERIVKELKSKGVDIFG